MFSYPFLRRKSRLQIGLLNQIEILQDNFIFVEVNIRGA